MKRFSLLLIPFLLVACNPVEEKIDFSLSVDKKTLKINEKVDVKVKLDDQKDIERAHFTYKTSDEAVLKPVEFKNNILTLSGVNAGNATITVTETTFNYTKSIKFYVSDDIAKTTMQQTYKDYAKNIYWSYYGYYGSTPFVGEVKLLVIPVWFTDSSDYIKVNENPLYKQYVHNDITATYLGTNEEVGYRSVKTYYEEESGGKLTLTGTVTDWFDTEEPSSNYSVSSSQTNNLLQNAVAWAESKQGINPNDYDYDKDGFIDGVILIYARPDCYSLEGNKNNFWAYSTHDTRYGPSHNWPAPNVYFWASYDFMYAYGDNARARTGSNYGRGNTYRQILATETNIHEMGHMFGLLDYYDTTGNFSPAGAYTMQDENHSTHDPFSYIALNWADPYIPTKSCTLTIGDFATTHDVILLTPEWNEYDSAFDEYILLELYSLTGLNEHYKGDWFHGIMLPDGVGVRVWHVDARLLYNAKGGYSEDKITCNTNDGDYVYRLCDNSYAKIDSFPGQQRGSFICENQNMLQLISHVPERNHGLLSSSTHFDNSDLFLEGSSFTLGEYKQQFIDIDSGEYYTAKDKDIKLNNRKKLNWSFTVDKIITDVHGASTAVITLNKLA